MNAYKESKLWRNHTKPCPKFPVTLGYFATAFCMPWVLALDSAKFEITYTIMVEEDFFVRLLAEVIAEAYTF